MGHARFYSPVLGRFTQPDTVIPNAENPQAWNRYSYVMNSPVLYNDPSGHMEESDKDGKKGCTDRDYCKDGKYEKDKKDKNNDKNKSKDWWEKMADILFPPILGADGSKEELFGTAAFQGGGVWGVSLITTSGGDSQFFYEHGGTVTVGYNLSGTYTRGLVYGIDEALDYKDGSHSASLGIEVAPPVGSLIVGGWEADKGPAWGLDYGVSAGISLPVALGAAHTTADPIGKGFELKGVGLFGCRLVGMCGR